MVLYFEPQILYGMTRPTKMQRCQASSYQWKADTARQSLPTLLYGGFIKWHHTAVRDNQEKNSRSIERLFFLITDLLFNFIFIKYLHRKCSNLSDN